MGRKSIGNLYGTVSGSAEGWINELKRAEDATRTRGASIAGQIDALGRRVSRDFTFTNLGKGLLGGLGLGSAAGVAMTITDHFAGMWREAQEHAKTLEQRAEQIGETMRKAGAAWAQMAREQMTPERRLTSLQQELAGIMGKVSAEDEKRAKALRAMGWAQEADAKYSAVQVKSFEGEDFTGGPGNPGMRVRKFFDLQLDRAEEAQRAAANLRLQVPAVVKEIAGIVADFAKQGEEVRKKREENETEQAVREARANGRDFGNIKEISPDDEARAAAGLRTYREELRVELEKGSKYAERMEKEAGRLRPDEMTRRGLGTGANYAEVARQQYAVLADIRALIARAVDRLGTEGGILYAQD